MKQVRKIVIAVISILLPVILFFLLQRLVEPKYDGSGDMPLEGNFTAEYYQETTDHDVIMVGDCEVYENIDTMYLWKNYGITSYIRGNAQQLVWQSYYMLEDSLKYEKPKVVIYNVQSLEHAEPQRETYNRMTLDGMKWSETKWNAIRTSMCEGENMVDYIFPILRYHSRITSLNENDLKYYWNPKRVSHNGYYMRIDVLPASESDVADTEWLLGEDTADTFAAEESAGESGDDENGGEDLWEMMEDEDASELSEENEDSSELSEDEDLWAMMEDEDASELGKDEDLWTMMEDEDASELSEDEDSEAGAEDEETEAEKEDEGTVFGEMPMRYLDKMRELCEKNDIQLILMKAPSLSPVWYDSENEQVIEYAEKYHLPYINFYDLLEETGIDYETDTYDGGLHMNLSGADKVSGYLGKVLTTEYGIEDHRSDVKISKVYDKKYQYYEDMIAAQQKELDQYGEIRSY